MYKWNQENNLSGQQFNQLYLLNDISDGQQLLSGVACLRQWGVVIITSHHWAEPSVMISTLEERGRELQRDDCTTSWAFLSNTEMVIMKAMYFTIPVAEVGASLKHVPAKREEETVIFQGNLIFINQTGDFNLLGAQSWWLMHLKGSGRWYFSNCQQTQFKDHNQQ